MTPGPAVGLRLRSSRAMAMALALGWACPLDSVAGEGALGGGRAVQRRPFVSDVKGVIERLRASDPAVRAQAAKALEGADLGQFSALDDKDIATLAEALRGEEVPLRRAAAHAFSQLTHTPQGAALSRPALAALMAALNDPETRVSTEAAIALGHIGDRAALTPLIAALGDERGEVVTAAGAALGHLVDEGNAPLLVAALRHEKARRVVASLFGMLNEAAPTPELIRALSSPDVELRRGAALALQGLRDRRAAAALLRALTDPDAGVRASAARGLGWLGDRTAAKPLIAALQDTDPGVRLAAVEALRFVGGPDAVEPLIARLKDTDLAVRHQAIATLTKIGDGRAVQPLIELLADNDVGDTLFHTLGHWKGNQEVVRSLIAALVSPNELVRKRAAGTLMVDNIKVYILGREAVAPLLPLLRSPQVEVRRSAAFTLQTLAAGQFLDQIAKGPLTEASRDDDPQVQRFAGLALGHMARRP